MSHSAANGIAPRKLNIGIYGCRQAGKTRFLYQLLGGWHKSHRLLSSSPNCHAFLSTVEAQISTYGRSTPTVAKSEGLTVEVRRDGKGPPWKLTLRDLQGEVLADEIDALAAAAKQGVIPDQVRQCDAFLFFFDPTSADDPDHVEDHYRREKKRAELFIDFVLRSRENRHLPVVFIMTRLDLWEDDEEVKSRAEAWLGEVNEQLRQRYREVLQDHHPESLTDPKKNVLSISSVRGQEVEKVIERLELMAEQTDSFTKGARRGTHLLVGAGGVLAALFLGYAIFTLFLSPPLSTANGTGGGSGDLLAVAGWPADKVKLELDALDKVVASQPSGDTLPRVEQARQLNWALRWLPLKLSTSATLPQEHQDRLQNAWSATTALVRAKADGRDSSRDETMAILEAYLDDVYAVSQPSPDLAAAQNRYWLLFRQQIVGQIQGLLKKHEEVASEPRSALENVLQELGQMEKRIKESKVSQPEARKVLLEELQTATAFCEARINAGFYQAKFQVTSGKLTSPFGIALNRRRVTLLSPRKEVLFDLDLQPEKVSDKECHLMGLDKPGEIKLPLGNPGKLILCIRPDQRDEWDVLHAFEWPMSQNEPSLKALGLPFLRAKPGILPIELPDWSGYRLTVELSDLPAVPKLFTDALISSEGKKP